MFFDFDLTLESLGIHKMVKDMLKILHHLVHEFSKAFSVKADLSR